MNKSLSITAIALLLYAMLISSCMKDNFDFNKIASGQWNPSIAVAAIHSNMTLNDALIKYDKKNTDHLISKDKNDFLTLIYQKTVFSQYAWEFIKLSDQIFNTTLTFPGGQGSIPPEGIEIPITPYQFNFNTSDGKSLDRIVVKSGKFKVLLTTTSSTFNLIGNLKVSIPNAQKNGVALSTEIPIINNGDKTYSIETDLSGYTINNPLTVNLTLKVKPGTTLDAMNTLNVNGNFTNIQYSLLIGKLGNYNFNNAKLDNNVDINIFKNPQNDNFNLQFSLRKPVVGLLVNNSYGIPIDLYFTKLLASNSTKKNVVSKNLQGSGIPSSTNIWHINSPSIQEMGKTDTSNLTITYNNSNLQQCIEIFPNTLAYTVAASTTNNNSQNFVYDTSRFSVDVRVELPLWGYVKNFILKADTQSCEFPNSTQGNIKSMQMNIYSINSFPVDCDVQIYLCDANYNKLDSLLPVTSNVQHTFKAAPTYQSGDNEGKIMYPVKNLIQVSLDQDRIDKRKLRTMKHIITNATLSTQDANGSGSIPSVKFYSYYYLDVKIGVQADCVVSK